MKANEHFYCQCIRLLDSLLYSLLYVYQMKQLCREAIRSKNKSNINVEDLIEELTPKARARLVTSFYSFISRSFILSLSLSLSFFSRYFVLEHISNKDDSFLYFAFILYFLLLFNESHSLSLSFSLGICLLTKVNKRI